jgi:hypothetical protein
LIVTFVLSTPASNVKSTPHEGIGVLHCTRFVAAALMFCEAVFTSWSTEAGTVAGMPPAVAPSPMNSAFVSVV